ncbi:hypothetical protein [Candidatus Neomicrothrix sp.]|uniref:hypothetical protein n=1 Tax=Candidatus Neomicrothrix sp. TaxID=2719034 RepID=UPI001B4A889C|nr:hypothetical protein [Candidatus Microthrix sp.]MBK6311921.1 hypothetical protein [Candidatus Microthrix sp.]MBK6968317.1 hypothetical protein [Candidatus Microthrix sp.]MBK7166356.1 hypothetical protein [Candidatus Microthrix sp.]MBP9066130.1 hypothetical protein [Candidatus Microthrix sp.]HMS49102.1 hypothetical protein [Candidatus Microthrix sp.]
MRDELTEAGARTIRNCTIFWVAVLIAQGAWISLFATIGPPIGCARPEATGTPVA